MVVALVASSAAGGSQPLLGGQQPRADAVPPVEREALAALDVRVVGFEIRGADVLRRAVDDVVRQAPGRTEFLGEDRRTLSFVPQSSQVPGKPRVPLPQALDAERVARHGAPVVSGDFWSRVPAQVCQLEGFSSPTFESAIHLLSQRQHSSFQRE